MSPTPSRPDARPTSLAKTLLLTALSLGAFACSDSIQKGTPSGSESDGAATTSPDAYGGEESTTQTPETRDAEGPSTDTVEKRDTTPSPDAPEYGLTEQPYTTLQRVWAPIDPPEKARDAIQAGELEITDIDEYRAHGLGVEPFEGKQWAVHDELAPSYSESAADKRRSLLYFWQSADPQLIDEESPIRFEGVTDVPVGSTYRPQDHLTTQVFEAHVRSARRISEASGRPFDFAFVSGDFTDGGQQNEVEWALQILEGGAIHPDSGADNDPVPGPGNDFTDRFWSRGLGVPFYMTVGNHETLYVGSLPATDEVKRAAIGNEVYDFSGPIPGVGEIDGLRNGFRDASTETAEVVTSGTTPADTDRRIVPLEELLEMIRTAGGKPDGHGLTPANAENGKGYYSFRPLPDKPIRFVVLNTLMDDPAHVSGGINEEQFEWLENELDDAQSQGELVIVGGHHRTDSFTVLSPVSGGDLEDLLASYSNVILYLVGHGHNNAMKHVEGRDGGLGHWELMSASTVDFPMQTRILEIVYEGSGYLSVYVTNLGHNSPRGTLAHRARELAAARKLFLEGDVRDDWREQHPASNLLLRYELPDGVTSRIEAETWPQRIESEQTLKAFPEPAY